MTNSPVTVEASPEKYPWLASVTNERFYELLRAMYNEDDLEFMDCDFGVVATLKWLTIFEKKLPRCYTELFLHSADLETWASGERVVHRHAIWYLSNGQKSRISVQYKKSTKVFTVSKYLGLTYTGIEFDVTQEDFVGLKPKYLEQAISMFCGEA